MRLAKALLLYAAPSHRIESQLQAAAKVLEIDGDFLHIPGVIICHFGDEELYSTEMHFVKSGGRLDLGKLHQLHLIYKRVVHDEMSAKKATALLEDLIKSEPIYTLWQRCLFAFSISALICVLAFGGSLVDMFIAGVGGTFLCLMNLRAASKNQLYANVFE